MWVYLCWVPIVRRQIHDQCRCHGYRSKVTGDCLVLGSIDGINDATAHTNVGIGVTDPDHMLTCERADKLALQIEPCMRK